MPSLWFVMPAHGRLDLARICMTQLRRTCDELTDNGVEATAVVIADDDNLDTARELGFTIARIPDETGGGGGGLTETQVRQIARDEIAAATITPAV